MRLWETEAAESLHNAAAKAALNREGGDPAALQMLALELHKNCAGLVATVAPNVTLLPDEAGAVRERDGMLALDANLAQWLEGLDASWAEASRDKARARLKKYRAGELDAPGLFLLWADFGAGALTNVARTLWRVRVAERWRLERRVVALPRPLVENMATTMAPQPRQLRIDYADADADALVRMRLGGQVIAQREAPEDVALLQALVAKGGEGLSRLGERDALGLTLWIQRTVLLQHAAGVTNHCHIHVAGPWRERVCRAAGLSDDARKNVSEYLKDLSNWRWPLPGYRTVQGLALHRETDGGGLVIEASRLLAGEWVQELRELGEPIPAALLASVPLPFPVWDLSVVGPRLRRKAVAFLLRVWLELHKQAAALTQGNGVALDERALDLAEDCSMGRQYGKKLLAHWRKLDYLTRAIDADLWTLGKGHAAESAYLLEGAKRSAAGLVRYKKGLARADAGLLPRRKVRAKRQPSGI